MSERITEEMMSKNSQAAGAATPPLIGVAALMRRAFNGEDLRPLGAQLLARAQENPRDANALLDFSTVLQLTGNRENAMAVQAEAIAMQPYYTLPARQAGPGLRLLVIMGPGDLMSNTPVEFLLEDTDVSLELLYLTAQSEWPENVPDHDVMMVAVAESDANQPLLQRLVAYVADWPRPVVNLPEHIAVLSRDGVYAALKGTPGLQMPASVRIGREVLEALAHGTVEIGSILPDGGFPVIVRPLGSHAGQSLEKLAGPEDVAGYLNNVEAEGFFLSRFVDYSGSDGLFRKYRVALVEGRPFICHFAVSERWMVHYLNAGMAESTEKRAEEAAIMRTFDDEFARRHAVALLAIHQRMKLPYIAMDCAETASGELLIFESDNAMIVHAMDPEDLFPYKKPAMRKLFLAFRQMLDNARLGQAAG